MEAAVGPVANVGDTSVLHRVVVDVIDVALEIPPPIVGRRYRDISGLWHSRNGGKMAAEVTSAGLAKSPSTPAAILPA
jgi:hypothetical protein